MWLYLLPASSFSTCNGRPVLCTFVALERHRDVGSTFFVPGNKLYQQASWISCHLNVLGLKCGIRDAFIEKRAFRILCE